MCVLGKNNLSLNDDSQRLTKFGMILRSISLDKSPELWSILKGEMSLLGLRPLLMNYLPLYNSEQAQRMKLDRRNAISWEEEFRLGGLLDAQAISIMWVRYLSGGKLQHAFWPISMYQACEKECV
jgi:hypothetical protein